MGALVGALTFAIALLGLLVVGLLRSHAEILRRLHDLGVGLEDLDGTPGRRPARGVTRDQFRVFPEVPEPGVDEALPVGLDLTGVGVTDDAVSIRVVGAPHATLIAFLSSTCLTCQRFWDAFADPASLGLAAGVRLVVVTKGPEEESPARIAEVAPSGVPVVMSSDAWDAYGVPGSPYFVLVDGPSGQARGEGTGIDWPQVRGLLTQVSDDEVFAADLESRRVRKPGADDARERRVDQELLAAGIGPGDPSLFAVPVEHDHAHHDHDHDHDASEPAPAGRRTGSNDT